MLGPAQRATATVVCPSTGPQQQTRCSRFALWARRQENSIDRCTAGARQHGVWRVNAGSDALSAYAGS